MAVLPLRDVRDYLIDITRDEFDPTVTPGGGTLTQVNPALNIFWSGTGVTVLVEGNGGAIDPTTGLPPAGEWVDYSAGGYAMVNGDFLSKSLPRAIPCWRTRMTLTVLGPGTGLTSYVPCIVTPNGLFVSAGRPTTSANAYNPNSNP